MIEFLSGCLALPLDGGNCFTNSTAELKPAGHCSKGDVVLLKSQTETQPFQAGEVWFHSECNGTCWSLVSLWQLSSYDVENCFAVFSKQDNPRLVQTGEILQAVTHISLPGNLVRVLVPLAYR